VRSGRVGSASSRPADAECPGASPLGDSDGEEGPGPGGLRVAASAPTGNGPWVAGEAASDSDPAEPAAAGRSSSRARDTMDPANMDPASRWHRLGWPPFPAYVYCGDGRAAAGPTSGADEHTGTSRRCRSRCAPHARALRRLPPKRGGAGGDRVGRASGRERRLHEREDSEGGEPGHRMGAGQGVAYARERQEAASAVSRLCAVGDGCDDAGLSLPDLFDAHGVVRVSHVRSACVLRAHARHRVPSRQCRNQGTRSARIGCMNR
jgi:hypothetical protein